MIARLFAVLLVAILGLGLGASAHAHGGDQAGAPRAVAQPSSPSLAAERQAPATTAEAVAERAIAGANVAYDLTPAAPTDDHCHCDGGVCAAAAPLPPSAARTARQPQRGGPALPDHVTALNIVDPPLQPPER